MAVTLAADALTTLAAVKEELGITDTAQDDRLKRLINAATSAIKRYTSRELGKATVTNERAPLAGGPRIVFQRIPIVSVTSIAVEDSLVLFDTTAYIVESSIAGVVYVKAGLPRYGFHRSGIAQDPQPGTEAPILLLTYVGGFVTPAQADVGGTYAGETVTLPAELETACIDLVTYYNSHRGVAGEISSETLGDASVTYRDNGASAGEDRAGIPQHIRGRLNPYKRTFIV